MSDGAFVPECAVYANLAKALRSAPYLYDLRVLQVLVVHRAYRYLYSLTFLGNRVSVFGEPPTILSMEISVIFNFTLLQYFSVL